MKNTQRLLGNLLLALLFTALSACEPSSDKRNNPVNNNLESGLDLLIGQNEARPQDDFFAYVNGAWLETTEIPADRSSWGSFSLLHEESLAQLKTIIEEATTASSNNTARQKIGDFYTAYLDESSINHKGLSPLNEQLKTIAALSDHPAIATYFGKSNGLGINSPLGGWVDQDAKDSTRYLLYLNQSGLGLPDRDYYFDESQDGQDLLLKYREFIASLFTLAKLDRPEIRASQVLVLESHLAEAQWTRVENRNIDKTYNPRSLEELNSLFGKPGLLGFLDGLGIKSNVATSGTMAQIETVIVRQPSYLQHLGKVFTDTSVGDWQNYLTFHLLVSYAPFLSEPFEEAHFAFYNRTLNGQLEPQPRWKQAVSNLNANMGELLGQLYVEKHFPPEAKARMVELVDNLIAAYHSSIKTLDWMSEETRQRALVKLDQFTPKIAYPDQWKDYSGLEIDPDHLIGNIQRARLFNHQREMAKLGKAVDRSEWFMPPQMVNAYYNPGMNEIVFPAAILQPPFFNMQADDAVNYGGIGAVIGHEIGHGFDDQGSKYNGEGNLKNWWTEKDRKRFEQRTKLLIEQYGAYQPLAHKPELKLNGQLTLGENIGDLGGLDIALKAYQMANPNPPILDGFSGEQRVFLGWAQAWRVKRRDALVERLVKTDPHSPAKFRVNGVVRNIDNFYRAFEVKPGDELYLAPEQRVKIW